MTSNDSYLQSNDSRQISICMIRAFVFALVSRGRTAPAISNQPRLVISIEKSSKTGDANLPPPTNGAKRGNIFQLSVSAYRNSAKHFRYVQNRYSTSHVRTSAIFLPTFSDCINDFTDIVSSAHVSKSEIQTQVCGFGSSG